MASFYFLGTFQTLLFLSLAGQLTDRVLDRHFGPGKITVIIDDQKFKIPDEYVEIATKAKGQYKDMAIFRSEFIWPSFIPIRLATREDYETAKKTHNLGHFWITKAFPEKVDEALQIKSNTDGIVKNELVGKRQGFEKYQHYAIKSLTDKELTPTRVTYVLRDKSDEITDVIYCYGTIAPNAYSPQCEYSFVDKGLLYKVRFADQAQSENWAAWKGKSIEFIDQFRVKD